MSADPKYFTLEEYLALERSSDARYEYLDGQILLMSGGSLEHQLIADNVHNSLTYHLRDRNCRVIGMNIQIKVPAAPPYRYADGSVVCGEINREHFQGTDLITNPILLWEVLSRSTEVYDRGQKLEFYKSIPTLKEYLLIAQDRPRIEHYVRQSARKWDYEDVQGLESMIELPSINCTLALSEVYKEIRFQ